MFLQQGEIFGADLFFELIDLMRHDLEFPLEFLDAVLGTDEIFGVHVAVCSNGFIHILLLLELGFSFGDLLLEISDAEISDLHFLNHLDMTEPLGRAEIDFGIFPVGFTGFGPILFTLLLKMQDHFCLFLIFCFVALDFVF